MHFELWYDPWSKQSALDGGGGIEKSDIRVDPLRTSHTHTGRATGMYFVCISHKVVPVSGHMKHEQSLDSFNDLLKN